MLGAHNNFSNTDKLKLALRFILLDIWRFWRICAVVNYLAGVNFGSLKSSKLKDLWVYLFLSLTHTLAGFFSPFLSSPLQLSNNKCLATLEHYHTTKKLRIIEIAF